MNKFFGIGKVFMDVNYAFCMQPKLFAVANTFLEIQNYYTAEEKIVIKLEGINNIADKMYQQLYKGCNILIVGALLSNGTIQVFDFKILK